MGGVKEGFLIGMVSVTTSSGGGNWLAFIESLIEGRMSSSENNETVSGSQLTKRWPVGDPEFKVMPLDFTKLCEFISEHLGNTLSALDATVLFGQNIFLAEIVILCHLVFSAHFSIAESE